MMRKYSQKQKGTTLMEIIVTTAIVGVVGASIATFQADTFKLGGTVENSLIAADQARKLMRPMADEIRAMRISDAGAYPIELVDTNEIIFYTDVDGDIGTERVRYYLDAGVLMKGVIEPSGNPAVYTGEETTTALVDSITSTTTFYYYDSTYDGASDPMAYPIDPSDVRLIKIEFTIESDPNRAPIPLTVTTQIALRNIIEQ